MRCYNHKTAEAIGICCECHKGLCEKCGKEEKSHLLCSQECAQKWSEKEQMNDCAKRIYGIGVYQKRKGIPLTALFFLLLGILFAGWGIYNFIMYPVFFSSFDFFFIGFGVIFIIFSFLYWHRATKTGLNL